jgi:hypothetical protein
MTKTRMARHPDRLRRGTVTARALAPASGAAHGGSALAGRLPRWQVKSKTATAS